MRSSNPIQPYNLAQYYIRLDIHMLPVLGGVWRKLQGRGAGQCGGPVFCGVLRSVRLPFNMQHLELLWESSGLWR